MKRSAADQVRRTVTLVFQKNRFGLCVCQPIIRLVFGKPEMVRCEGFEPTRPEGHGVTARCISPTIPPTHCLFSWLITTGYSVIHRGKLTEWRPVKDSNFHLPVRSRRLYPLS